MPATLSDLIQAKLVRDAQAYRRTITLDTIPEPAPTDDGRRAPICESPDLIAAFAKLDEMSARCDALIERNGRWTRYVTGGDNVA